MIGRLAFCTALALIASLGGCVASSVRGERAASPREGLDGYRLVAGEARARDGCRYDYRVYEPLAPRQANDETGADGTTVAGKGIDGEPAAPVTVMLGHGFLRDQDRLVGLARALANAGFRAVTLDFCNMRLWNGHHVRNAGELGTLAERVAGTGTGVVYAGFSAGALAALIAGGEDPATLGVVTLDLVDQGALAAGALATLEAPLIGLEGPPSSCNAGGSGRRVFETRPEASLETIPGASHCEFESPTNRLCEIACGDDDPAPDDERVREDIVRRVVAAVESLALPRTADVGGGADRRGDPPGTEGTAASGTDL